MMFIHTEPAPSQVPAVNPAPSVPAGALGDAMDRHLTALGQHLDHYLASVARELQERGVITGSPQRTDPAQRLVGSIVLDCTALRVAAFAPDDARAAGHRSLGGAVHPERPAPVIVTWDEHMGWCAGLHHDSTRSSRRYLHSARLPAPAAVAEFVVGLALGEPLGAAQPLITAQLPADDDELGEGPPTAGRSGPGRPALRLVPDPGVLAQDTRTRGCPPGTSAPAG